QQRRDRLPKLVTYHSLGHAQPSARPGPLLLGVLSGRESQSRPRSARRLTPVDSAGGSPQAALGSHAVITIGNARVEALLADLLAGMREALGDKLVGLYLTGSLVVGDFDPVISNDVDVVGALASEVDDAEFERLRLLHE